MSDALARWGRWVAHHPWRTVAAWLVLTATVVAVSATAGRDLEPGNDAPGMDSQVASDLMEDAGLVGSGLSAQVVATPADGGGFDASPGARHAVQELREDLAALPAVRSVTDPWAPDGGGLSPDGRVALVTVAYPPMEELSSVDWERMGAVVDRADGEVVRVETGGELAWEFGSTSSGATELAGLVVAALVLLVAFGSVLAMGLPLVTALFGLAVGLTGLGLVAWLVEIPEAAPPMAAMVGLGVGIDYALFLLTRHREGLASGRSVPDSVGDALATAGRAVLFAGGTVVVSIMGLAVAGLPFVTAIGLAIAVVVAVMMLASLTLLPALLAIAGRRVVPRRDRGRTRGGPARAQARWQRWGSHLGRHPWPWALGATALLLLLAAPALALRLGTPDQGTYPLESTERQAYDLVADGFGDGATGPLLVVLDGVDDHPRAVQGVREALAQDDGVAAVAPARVDPASGIAVVTTLATTSPQDDETRTTVHRIRDEVLPGALAGTPVTAHVGGQTALLTDLGDRVEERLPWFVGAVVLLSLVLLVLVFRSVVLPLKAAALNLLSVGAAYGVLVMVFQWGWGASLIGVDAPVPVISFVPMLMFAVLFGLSMDYEVFLLSRVREAWLRTGDTPSAVVEGLSSTARTISAAAAIMVSVFIGFALAPDPTVTMLGLGLAVAIALDATVVRLVLVPTAMRLLGAANWWLPGWLDRRLPHGRTAQGPVAPESGPVPVAVGG